MRLTQEQVKQGILHPEQIVRDAVLRYFSDSFSTDPGVMPLAVQAIETYGPDAFWHVNLLASLTQTEDTLLWLIDQLNRMGRPQTNEEIEWCYRLSSIIADADVGLLMRHEEKVLGLEGMDSKHRDVMAERLRLITLDTASCWEELEKFCSRNSDQQYINNVDLPHAERLAEAIARDEASAERVLALLSLDYKDNPIAWMEGLAVHTAGLMRLEAAVPMLVAKLMEDGGDYVNEQCLYAFPMIGTDSTIDAICKDFASAPWHYRLYASSSLERIHTDFAVSKCQELLGQEKDGPVRLNLMAAVLGSFCPEGIEPARKITISGNKELRGSLVAVTTLMGASFPELEKFRQDEKKHQEDTKRRGDSLTAGATPPRSPAITGLMEPTPPSPLVGKKNIGRNDPCPCKSGKKYKKCCGRNE